MIDWLNLIRKARQDADDQTEHLERLVASAVDNSGYSISQIAEAAQHSRPWVYAVITRRKEPQP